MKTLSLNAGLAAEFITEYCAVCSYFIKLGVLDESYPSMPFHFPQISFPQFYLKHYLY